MITTVIVMVFLISNLFAIPIYRSINKLSNSKLLEDNLIMYSSLFSICVLTLCYSLFNESV